MKKDKEAEERRTTEWGMLASGEGANRIAIQYLAEFFNPSISDRILLLNTTHADIRPEKAFGKVKNVEFEKVFDRIRNEKTCIFGASPSGAGNVWKIGEEEAVKDFDTIRRYIANSPLAQADVMLGITTLGGGTGNGSIPPIINQLKYRMHTTRQDRYIALGIWPLYSEAPQRHFNAVCGLTRLLRYGAGGQQNADMVMIVHNGELKKHVGTEDVKSDKYYHINMEIIRAIELMMAPSRLGAEATIDVADYYELPTNFGVYHFTPCVSWGNDPDIMGLDAAMELAIRNPMAPLEEKTATMAYFVARAPKKRIEDGEITQEGLEESARRISGRFMAGKDGGLIRYCSLTHGEGDNFDIMILLGGFSLKKLLASSAPKYRAFSDGLRGGEEVEVEDDKNPRIKAKIKRGEIDKLEGWMKEYATRTENLIRRTKKERAGDDEITRWFGAGK